jgi:hypothetical protein
VNFLNTQPPLGWLLFVDGDAVFQPNSLLKLLQTAYADRPDADVVGAFCVSGETRILHRGGYDKIAELVGRDVEVWNGRSWSSVRPFQTGVGRKLLRIHLSDGSQLDCTPEHRFAVKTDRKGKTFTPCAAKDLLPGKHILPSFQVPASIVGNHEPEAYTYGAFLGDGAYYARPDSKQWRREISLYPGKYDLPVSGTRGSAERVSGSLTVTLAHLDETKLAALKSPALPDWVFQLDHLSTLAFLAGWFDTDGTSKGVCGGGIELTTISESRARGAQLLLRRAGVSYASVRKMAAKGQQTNFGARQNDLWSVRVAGRDAGMIPGHRVTGSRPMGKSPLRQVRVVAVKTLEGEHDTFCFTEHEQGMGVFGNVLTFQCTLRGEPYLPTIDTGTGTWESWLPGQGVIDVMRTGSAFILIKRHVFEKVPGPWYGTRNPMRPIDALAEVDNFAHTKFDGRNPLAESPEWQALLQCAKDDPSSHVRHDISSFVGEDSNACDWMRFQGLTIVVNTDVEVHHVDRVIRSAADHRDVMKKRDGLLRACVGLQR